VPALAEAIKENLSTDETALDRLARLEAEHHQQIAHIAQLTERNTLLVEEVRWLKSQLFGRSSEKSAPEVSAEQSMLFNEAEVLAAIAAAEEQESKAVVQIEGFERKKKPGRKAIPGHFPRTEVLHDIPESEKVCLRDGTPLVRMGEETSEQYEYSAPQLKVLHHVRPKYACPCCHEGVKIAPVPAQLLPKSMASPSMLAHITTAKFVDGLPLTRQSKQFARLGLDMGAGTMGVWMNTIGGESVVPLIHLMNETMLSEPFIHCDETPLQVLKSDKAPTSEHYMWVRAAGPPGRRMILFDYAPTRNVEALMALFTGPDGRYSGKLISDGLKIYDSLAEAWGLQHFGCLSHCRRYFVTAEKVGQSPTGRTLARVVIRDYIGALYAVERHIKSLRERREQAGQGFSLDEVLKIRQERSVPIAAGFKKWLDEIGSGVPPTSALGKAITYSLSQWPKLVRYLDHPEMPPDNNRVENAIRPFAVGRAAWMFCDTQAGARASANLYSLVSTTQANGIEPLAYLTYLYTHLPAATTLEQLETLLPWNVKPLLMRAAAANPLISSSALTQVRG
jgi:transposase